MKGTPVEAAAILGLEENSDLCLPHEYAERFSLPPPASITLKIQNLLVNQGYVAREYFTMKQEQEMITNRVSHK